jgi:hypothetical protein
VCTLVEQIDPTPRHARTREEEADPTLHCIQVRLGTKRISSGNNKGERRPIQGRCTACIARNRKLMKRGRAPRTAWGCACHRNEFFCKNTTCWQEHLNHVWERNENMFAI